MQLPAGHLDVGGGHRLWWYEAGSPEGTPAVLLHGGPGSGSSPASAGLFDASAYRLVLFDQRQCGRSTPHAGDPLVDLTTNTTEHLLADIEVLREDRGIDRWVVYGHSWGALLGVLYAQRHPDRVRALILVGCPTGRRSETEWLYGGVGMFFPAEFDRFRRVVPESARDGDLVESYHQLVEGPDPSIRRSAAAAFHEWEWTLVSADADSQPPPTWLEPSFQLARARIVTNYFRNGCWLEDDDILRGADALAGIPGVLITGRLDVSTPVRSAWDLVQHWPGSELVIVPNAGHAASDGGMYEAIRSATDRFADAP